MSDKPPIRGVKTSYGEPHSSLTKIADEALAELGKRLGPDVKCIAFINDGDRGGIGMHGYDDTLDALTDLFIHMRAMFNAMGKDMQFVPVEGDPNAN